MWIFISFCVPWKKFVRIWNNRRVSNPWHNFPFVWTVSLRAAVWVYMCCKWLCVREARERETETVHAAVMTVVRCSCLCLYVSYSSVWERQKERLSSRQAERDCACCCNDSGEVPLSLRPWTPAGCSGVTLGSAPFNTTVIILSLFTTLPSRCLLHPASQRVCIWAHELVF